MAHAPRTKNRSSKTRARTSAQAAAKPAVAPLLSSLRLFKPSWRAVIFNIGALFNLVLIPVGTFVGLLVLGIIILRTVHPAPTASDIQQFQRLWAIVMLSAITLVTVVLMPAFYLLQLKSVRGAKTTASTELQSSMRMFWPMIATIALSGVPIMALSIGGIVLLGQTAPLPYRLLEITSSLLLLAGALWFLQRFMLAPFYACDRGMRPMAAMRASARAATRYPKPLWGVTAIRTLSRVIGFVPVLGWIISTVIDVGYNYAPAVRYVEITDTEDGVASLARP